VRNKLYTFQGKEALILEYIEAGKNELARIYYPNSPRNEIANTTDVVFARDLVEVQ
jgi:hypothetical protein